MGATCCNNPKKHDDLIAANDVGPLSFEPYLSKRPDDATAKLEEDYAITI